MVARWHVLLPIHHSSFVNCDLAIRGALSAPGPSSPVLVLVSVLMLVLALVQSKSIHLVFSFIIPHTRRQEFP